MRPGGSSLWGGILYSVPFACWFFAVVDGAETRVEIDAIVADAFRILVLVQVLAATLLHPALQRRRVRHEVSAVVALFAVPWPLLVVFWLAGNIEAWLLGLSQVALVVGTLGLLALAGAGQHVAIPALRPYAAVAVQVAGFAVLLSVAGPWLAWTG